MTISRQAIITFIIGTLLGALCGFLFGKGMYQSTDTIKVRVDTLEIVDTVFYPMPYPKETIQTKFVTEYLPVVTRDTVARLVHHHDTVAVQVPITQNHYKGAEYDAWVSGYKPSLDSIKVYQKTEYINTETTITKTTRRKPWGIGFHAGYGYDFKTKTAAPFIGVGLSYNIISF